MFSKLCANNIYMFKYALGADIKTYDNNNNFSFGVGNVYDKENGWLKGDYRLWIILLQIYI